MKSIIIGTAGHVDHGKTRLIGKLTGTNTDRLKEEQQRGISIELGFAELQLGEVQAGIIDVPGHEKFVRTMVAGAGGMDMAVVVVAADEGVMQQTREHVEVLELLGVTQALVALTKIDMVDEEMVELAAEDVRDYFDTTRLAGIKIMPVSSETGEGLDELLRELTVMAEQVPERSTAGAFRLPIDRVFTLTGMGTVVTGTSWSGKVRVGDQLELLPRGIPVRIRSLQVHDQSVDEARAGQRTALALHGVKHDELERGEVLATPGRFGSGNMVTMKVRVLTSCPWTIKQRSRLRFHFGTGEVLGRLILLEQETLEAGQTVLAQARLQEPVICAPGDHVIIRFYSPMLTVAGGVVLEAQAPKRRHGRAQDIEAVKLKESGDPAQILEKNVLDSGLQGNPEKDIKLLMEKYRDETSLPRLLEARRVVLLGKRLFHADLLDDLGRAIENRISRFHEERPLAWGLGREKLRSELAPDLPLNSFQKLLEHLEGDSQLQLRDDLVRVAAGEPEATGEAVEWVAGITAAWLEGGLTPPPFTHLQELGIPADMVPDLVNHLVNRGILLRLSTDFLVHRETLETLRSGLQELFDRQEILAVGDVGQHFGISRKYTVPLLEHCDLIGWTVRSQAERRRGAEL